MTLAERLNAYERLLRLDKPIGTLLLLWPALWGLWFAAHGVPNLRVLLVFLVHASRVREAVAGFFRARAGADYSSDAMSDSELSADRRHG